MEDTVNIKEVEKLYPDEWLLFEVTERDKQNRPLKGRLLSHSKERDEIDKVDMQTRCADAVITYTGDPIPKDMAVVL